MVDGYRAVRHSLERPIPVLLDEPVKQDVHLYFPKEFNMRQGHNECGPYTAAGHIFAQKQSFVHPDVASRQMNPRMPNGYSYPHVFEEVLHRHGVDAVSYDTGGLSAPDLFRFYQQHLGRQQPVSVLTVSHGVNLFSLVLGAWMKKVADAERMMPVLDIYDPLIDGEGEGLTSKQNDESRPGNKTVPLSRFARKVGKGGKFGLYKGLAVTGFIE